MAVGTAAIAWRPLTRPPLMLGGPAALAESAWMGAAQATDVLEPARLTVRHLRPVVLPRLRLAGLLTREFSIAEATFLLMCSFFFSALLGAVRQVLFNAQFGATSEANAYYAAFRLSDTLFSLIAGGALSSAMIPVLLALVFLGRLTIRVLFERGKFDAIAGALTYDVLVAYAVALPAYVCTEVITRGLIALHDTRTPLFTNTHQLVGRAAIITLLLGALGIVAIPVAFAVSASLETLALGTVLLLKVQHRMRAHTEMPAALAV